MEIKQKNYPDVMIVNCGNENKGIGINGAGPIVIESDSIPAVCAVLLGCDRIACFWNGKDVGRWADEPEPKPNLNIIYGGSRVAKTEPKKTKPGEMIDIICPVCREGRLVVSTVSPDDHYSEYSCGHSFTLDEPAEDEPNPAYAEPEFEFEWEGEKHKVVDNGNLFAVFCERGAPTRHWVRVSIDDRPKDFLAKVLPYIEARLAYRKEWRRV